MLLIFLMVILMIILGRVKYNRIPDFCHNGLVKSSTCGQFLLGLLSQFTLSLIVYKDRCTILGSAILELTSVVGWVNLRPVKLQQPLIGKQLRIECDFNHLNVSGSPCFDLLICGMFNVTACIPGYNSVNAWLFFKWCNHTPETSPGKCRFFHGLSLPRALIYY
ncbi:hypothetical protein D3C76_1432980 [compost metagenome]